MRWKALAASVVAETVALARRASAPRYGLRILMYHAVGSPVRDDRLGIFSISPHDFRAHVDLLASMPEVRTVPLEPLELPQNSLKVAVTFDDGYQDNLDTAAPLLVERGIPFSVFVTTDFVKERVQGFLTLPTLKALANFPGATIGAHGRSHRSLLECNDADLMEELTSSKSYLEDITGRPVSTLAYPYGATNRRVRDAAERAGYTLGLSSRFDINRPGRDRLMLNRCNVLRGDSPRILRQKLRGDWDWYRWRSRDPLEGGSR
jgi:peptidoglycan/xylan/chitin deacetylase (PgdA/CDA1 family)